MADADAPPSFITWRHPRPHAHAGRCIGRTDLRLDPRKARRLARRIHRHAVLAGLPRVVGTSALRRCRDVGRHLRQLGWRHVIDNALLEADFGAWEGRPWGDIPREEVDAWVADFLHGRPGGGESLQEVLLRASAWQPLEPGMSLVGHAGWMLARRWVQTHGLANPPHLATQWPKPPAHGEAWAFSTVV